MARPARHTPRPGGIAAILLSARARLRLTKTELLRRLQQHPALKSLTFPTLHEWEKGTEPKPAYRQAVMEVLDALLGHPRAAREEAAASEQPATVVARQAIETRMRERRRAVLREAIAAYAVEHAGTGADLDADLEAAALELWRPGKRRRR